MAMGVQKRIELTESFIVQIRAVYNSGEGILRNLSSTGAYVETAMYLLPQAQVRLEITLPDEDRSVLTDAVVAWENRGKVRRGGLAPGYGLRFIHVPEETTAAIDRLLSAAGPHEEAAVTEESHKFGLPSAVNYEIEEDTEGPPFPLRKEIIRARVPPKAAGILVLSYDRAQDAFIGRADDDLRSSLEEYIGEYAFFYFEIIDRVDERFYRECEFFHRFGGDHGQLDNTMHPRVPEGSGLSCPMCPRDKVEGEPPASPPPKR
jgi:hypothetical protein